MDLCYIQTKGGKGCRSCDYGVYYWDLGWSLILGMKLEGGDRSWGLEGYGVRDEGNHHSGTSVLCYSYAVYISGL